MVAYPLIRQRRRRKRNAWNGEKLLLKFIRLWQKHVRQNRKTPSVKNADEKMNIKKADIFLVEAERMLLPCCAAAT